MYDARSIGISYLITIKIISQNCDEYLNNSTNKRMKKNAIGYC